jgi:hypothetical protein
MARQARRAVIASTVGTMIEWYDFYAYGLVAGLVFGKLYFPRGRLCRDNRGALDLFLGFVARPIGAAFSGITAIASAVRQRWSRPYSSWEAAPYSLALYQRMQVSGSGAA